MTRVILSGCNGHMGQAVRAIAANDPEIEICAGLDITEGDAAFPVFTDSSKCDVPADVIIDFSSAKALDNVLGLALSKKLPLVLCTTGFSPEQLESINRAALTIPILRSANMSLGINTVVKLIQEAARILSGNGYDIEIVERHHNRKLDAPSGTALLLADAMQQVLDGDYDYVYGRADRREKRPEKEIGISSVRGGNIVGDHEVIFAGLDEVIEVKHTAYSRSVFAKGAVSAAKFLCGKPAGMYNMGNVIE